MSVQGTIIAAAEGGVIGSGRTGANLALGVGLLGLALGWATRARGGRRVGLGGPRAGAIAAMTAGVAGTFLAVLHLATSSGGPGTGNGLVGAVVAVPLGLAAVFLGRRALIRSRSEESSGAQGSPGRPDGTARLRP
ncbi:hypothetical protein DY218_24205 [Streptomyces triticagri]|uniref:Uncharacterized protein n=1 Tax=Streptomyces triticagri TaxID=2293568 RepID=A0A372LZQ6_9ACTN|nr:DUF6223 family protein [Streptomyces triticagri]RFU84174.1 hypothetical protein DY218_24205 [Streptomyces triticagri]